MSYFAMDQCREHLLKRKAQYSWPPCTDLYRSTAYNNANIIYFLQNKLPKLGG